MSVEVLEGQQWLNSTYGSNENYIYVPETGLPGTAMSQALVSAMQIELGVSPVTGTFGPLTSRLCDSYPLSMGDYGNRVRIIQYGFYSKGYDPNGADSSFGNGCLTAVRAIQSDAGLDDSQSSDSIRGLQAKAILGVDEYKLVSGGSNLMRAQQQYLNHYYLDYTGLCACDGIYSRSTNTALILALQAEEGMPTSMANGNFGPSTKQYLPTIGTTLSGSGHNGPYSGSEKLRMFLRLAQIALYGNGMDRYTGAPTNRYENVDLDGTFNIGTQTALSAFQRDYNLAERNYITLNEWMALLVSTGNPDRAAEACDCATQLSVTKAQRLHEEGYKVVGRYLTGTVGSGSSKVPKNLTRTEAQRIFDAGMRFFPIFQDDEDWWQSGATSLREYFTLSRGLSDAQKAVQAALQLGMATGEIIYFAIDYDYMAEELTQYAIPYFEGINSYVSSIGNPYRIGIYSARNTCGTICARGLAVSSFVSDMSTGYSGNLGYPIPQNWAYDQIKEYSLASSDGSFGIDKDVMSGQAEPVGSLVAGSSLSSADLVFQRLVGDKKLGVIPDVIWDDTWFSTASSTYNHSLATTAAAFSTLAYANATIIRDGISKFGFALDDIRADAFVGGDGPIGFFFASKMLTDGVRLVVIAVRGTANEAEWLSNMDISGGAAGIAVHKGFDRAEQNVRSSLTTWLSGKGISPATAKFIVTGHSRGAAVANLLASRIVSFLGTPAQNVYAYTFATPNVFIDTTASNTIFNIINPEDFVPRIPLELWGFGKNGTQLILPSSSNREPLEWATLHSAMNGIFRELTGVDHTSFIGGTSETDGFVELLAGYAPSLSDFYYRRSQGDEGITLNECFIALARFLSDSIGVFPLIQAFSQYPDLLAYFAINNTFNPCIFPAHTPETYLSWMKSQTSYNDLFA